MDEATTPFHSALLREAPTGETAQQHMNRVSRWEKEPPSRRSIVVASRTENSLENAQVCMGSMLRRRHISLTGGQRLLQSHSARLRLVLYESLDLY